MKTNLSELERLLLDSLKGFVDRPLEFDGGKIIIDDGAHDSALRRVRMARDAIAACDARSLLTTPTQGDDE